MGEPKVLRVPLRLANSYLVIDKKTIIVDTGDPGFTPGIIQALRKNNISRSDVSMILITHGHIDHYGSVFKLRKYIDAPIAIQRIDEQYMATGVQAPLYPMNKVTRLIKFVGKDMQVKKRYGLKAADIVFDEELELSGFGVDGIVTATPGHTLGSASLVTNQGEAITGDLVLRKYFLRGIPVRSPFMHDGEKLNLSIKKLIDMGVKTLHPGHGGPISSEELYMLRERIDATKTGI